jgi:ornithine racemase
MAELSINVDKLIGNINKLSDSFDKQDVEWSLIVKILNGHRGALEKLLQSDAIKRVHSVGDSRLSNLRTMKSINPDVVTMYIKPPVQKIAGSIVKYADISLNSSLSTIKTLDKEARKLGVVHRVIVMIELGELREGVIREKIFSFYEEAFRLENIDIIGLGTNLGCLYGIEPTYDKMIQLALYAQLLETKFGKKLEIVSGGSSITMPLLRRKKLPKGVNHLRIGETAFLGVTLDDRKRYGKLSTTAFEFKSEIVEIEKKETVPDGEISDAGIGNLADEVKPLEGAADKSYRCLLDFGQMDSDAAGLTPKDSNVAFVGSTSDMTVYDVGKESDYHVGDAIKFDCNYMAIAHLMHSRYINKRIIYNGKNK